MTEQNQNPLCKLIREIKDDINPISNDFEVVPLSLPEKEKYEGFMIFSKEEYSKEEQEKIDNVAKFKNYLYKHRYYALYKITSSQEKETIQNKEGKTLVFILYNPSYANPEALDGTVKNCITLAEAKKYSNVEILNLFSLRNTNPPISKLLENKGFNKNFLEDYIKSLDNEKFDIVLAWGYGKSNDEELKDYCEEITKFTNGKNTFHIGVDADIVNKLNHHPANTVWAGIGTFDDIATLVPIIKIDKLCV